MQEFGFSVVFHFKGYYRHLAANLIANMRYHNLTNEIVGTTDKAECDFLERSVKDSNVLCVTYDSDQYQQDYELEAHRDIQSKEKEQVRRRHFDDHADQRWLIAREVLRLGASVLLLDTDVAFMRSPLSTLQALDVAGVDVAINCDDWREKSPELNIGTVYLRRSNAGLAVVEDTWVRLVNNSLNAFARKKSSYDQRIFTDAVESMLGDYRSFRLSLDFKSSCSLEPSPNVTVEHGCHFDPRATQRLLEAYRTRQPVEHKGFTLQMVSDQTFGFQDTQWKLYGEHRLNGTRPKLEDLPTVLHVRGMASMGEAAAASKMGHLQMFGLWQGPKMIGRELPNGPLVQTNITDMRDEAQLARLMDLCTQAKPKGQVIVLSSQECIAETAVTVFNWPHLFAFNCYDHVAYGWSGSTLLKTDVRESCEHNLLMPFETPYFIGTNNSS
ncbi:hypothetical protein CYMTET_17951 [Cymbomonas tetramitiformis]|uniref:Nucleotide-diphospho-sugar transferase domain-containing protein n=1 Tax=Cymbomonas tetramitiformis TaxID=36881 RepID=A0AAE0L6R4_9CHLO|nr:hypothetical protein CYMTET_17951 [Cymbomonas tetramitiformis]